jgi:prepilin-type N-terminal cleavage/methylation domain-containing protein
MGTAEQSYRGDSGHQECYRFPVPGSRLPARSGFTLIEVIVALMILVIVGAVTAPAFLGAPRPRPALEEAQGSFEALFRLARDSAVRAGVPVTVVLDSATNLVWIDAPPPANATLVDGRAEGAESVPVAGVRQSAAARGTSRVGATTRPDAMGPAGPGQSMGLPAGVRVELFQRRALFTFGPDGTVLADSLMLSVAGGARRLLTLDPWISRVRIR